MTDTTEQSSTRIQELLTTYDAPITCVAELLCDRHSPEAVAFRVLDEGLGVRDLSYGELAEQSRRLAAGLAALGVQPGDRVATLMGKSVDLVVAVLGIWRVGAVHVPLFTAFAGPAVQSRLDASGARAVLVSHDQRDKVPAGQPAVVVAGGDGRDGDARFADLLSESHPAVADRTGDGGTPVVQLYTSGTTGRPKGVVVPTRALASFQAYMELGLDVRKEDVYWNVADPGWAYGLYYGLIGPLMMGIRSLWVQGGFAAEQTLDVLAREGVTNFAGAPTVYRAIRASGLAIPTEASLRCASAAGEPLTPDVNEWARSALGVEVHDHYGQTETGMLVNNHQHPVVRSAVEDGSMGRAMPGWKVVVLENDADVPAGDGEVGRLAVDLSASPLRWFEGYADEPGRSAEKFTADGRYYLTGDAASTDAAGTFRFTSRDDDVIIMAGYRIGPFDIESVLVRHPAVAEAAVVAVADDLKGQAIAAHVVLHSGHQGSRELAGELREMVKEGYARHAAPRDVEFHDALPRTPSGKVQRFLLRGSDPSATPTRTTSPAS
jgi:acetyl-CoA synthetase